MSYRKQSKRARFARKAKVQRQVASVHNTNRSKPGFVGVATGISIRLTGAPTNFGAHFIKGPAAVFMYRKENTQ